MELRTAAPRPREQVAQETRFDRCGAPASAGPKQRRLTRLAKMEKEKVGGW
jgi:hypothetical protein